jgi:glycosyltransferase involved in cell wall biosynthesis
MLIDDYSNDNSVKLIEKYQEKDKRIILNICLKEILIFKLVFAENKQ